MASDVGAGAGYGGAGSGDMRGNPGGITYGSSNAPADAGSAGGNGSSGTGGGHGGGVVWITASDRVILDGTISANGRPPLEGGLFGGYAAGGGSGGSIWIHTLRFFATGSLRVDGGNAGSFMGGLGAGGGGGGRIAVWRVVGDPCSASVTGGVGFAQAGTGTVVWGQLIPAGTIFVVH